MSIPLLLLAYALGSVPSGILIARALGSRPEGDGAAGFLRTKQQKTAALTAVLDFCKGSLPVLLALIYWPQDPFTAGLAALFVVSGHCYSVFLLFRGGKGVATTAGALFALAPLAMLAAAAAGCLAFSVFRHAALAALLAIFVLIGALFALKANAFLIVIAAVCSLMMIRGHRACLEELLATNPPGDTPAAL